MKHMKHIKYIGVSNTIAILKREVNETMDKRKKRKYIKP